MLQRQNFKVISDTNIKQGLDSKIISIVQHRPESGTAVNNASVVDTQKLKKTKK